MALEALAEAGKNIKKTGSTIVHTGETKIGGSWPYETNLSDHSSLLMTDPGIQTFMKGTLTKGKLDDPTYLGFTLIFDWYNSPLFNGWITSNKSSNASTANNTNDIPFDEASLDAYNAGSSTTTSSTKNYSNNGALGYLINRGLNNNASNLELFIKKLYELSTDRPYYFQTISGLDVAWQKWVGFNKNPYRGGEDSILTIDTLENIELTIQNLLYTYQLAVDDMKYRREIVPDNMVKFDLLVHIMEIRNFKDYSDKSKDTGFSKITGSATEKPDNSALEWVQGFKSNMSDIMLTFKTCEFLPDRDNKIFSDINDNEHAKNSISIKYEDVEISSFTNWFNDSTGQNASMGTKDIGAKSFLSKVKDKIKEVAVGAANGLISAAALYANKTLYSAANIATNLIEESIQKLMPLGNIYDGKLSVGDIMDVVRAGNLISGIGLGIEKAKTNNIGSISTIEKQIYDSTKREFKGYDAFTESNLFNNVKDVPTRIADNYQKIDKTVKMYEIENKKKFIIETSNILNDNVNMNLKQRVSNAYTKVKLLNLYK